MKTIKTSLPLLFTVALLLITNSATAAKTLTGEELKTLLTGNFMKVIYIYEGEKIKMWEYYQKDGSIAGSTDKWGNFRAGYEIKGDKICVTYNFEAYNGCYAYQHKAGSTYKLVGLTWPENATAEVTIIKGLYDSLQ